MESDSIGSDYNSIEGNSKNNLKNGVRIKEEMMEDSINDYKMTEIQLPVISNIKGEYKEFHINEVSIKHEIDDTYEDQFRTNNSEDLSDSLMKEEFSSLNNRQINALNEKSVYSENMNNVKIEYENNKCTNLNDETKPNPDVIDLSDCDSPTNDQEDNNLLVARAIKVLSANELKPNKRKKTSSTAKHDSLTKTKMGNHKSFPLEMKCNICFKIFKYVGPFEKHKKSHPESEFPGARTQLPPTVDENSSLTITNITSSRIDEKPSLDNTDETPSTSENLFKCWCGSFFDDKDRITDCLKSHGGFMCIICYTTFRKKNSLSIHSRTHEPKPKRFECKICGLKFTYHNSFLRHESRHMQQTKKDESNPVSVLSLNNEVAIRVNKPILENKRVSCKECLTCFDNALTLKVHVALTHGKLQKKNGISSSKSIHTCKICTQVFNTDKLFDSHKCLQNKTAIKYMCKHCNFQTTSLNDYRSHLKSDCSNVKPSLDAEDVDSSDSSSTQSNRLQYECDVCSQRFNSQVQMVRHKQTHPFITIMEKDSTEKKIFYK